MNDRELKWIGNGIVLYGFGFVMYGMNVLASICAVMNIMIVLHRFGIEKMLKHWFMLFMIGLMELILIERSGMAVSSSSLFIVSVADLLHAYAWCMYGYRKHDYYSYLVCFAVCCVFTVCMDTLPFGFLNTILVIILVFIPYIFMGKEREKILHETYKNACRKKHIAVIE